jgi:hypothetical protein
MLRAGVEGPCRHRPENWLVRQLNDELKPIYKVGFIRKKGKATAREVQRSPEAHGSLHRWRLGSLWTFQLWVRGGFSLARHFKGFLRWTGLVCTFIGGGETILRALCSSALWQIYQTLYLSFRMQECRPPSPQDRNDSALHGGWDAHSSASGLQMQQKDPVGKWTMSESGLGNEGLYKSQWKEKSVILDLFESL